MKKNVSFTIYKWNMIESMDGFFFQCMNIFFIGSGKRSGKILQRFPEKDWPDTPFIEGIEWVRILLLTILK